MLQGETISFYSFLGKRFVGQAVALPFKLVFFSFSYFFFFWPEGFHCHTWYSAVWCGGGAFFTKVKSANFHLFFFLPTVFFFGDPRVLFQFFFLLHFLKATSGRFGSRFSRWLAGPIMIVWQILMMPLGLMKLLLVQQTRDRDQDPPWRDGGGRLWPFEGCGWRMKCKRLKVGRHSGIEYAHDVRLAASISDSILLHCTWKKFYFSIRYFRFVTQLFSLCSGFMMLLGLASFFSRFLLCCVKFYNCQEVGGAGGSGAA